MALRFFACWLASTAFWFALACVKARKFPGNYHEACDLWGLCCWWPLTITLEALLILQLRRQLARDNRERGKESPKA